MNEISQPQHHGRCWLWRSWRSQAAGATQQASHAFEAKADRILLEQLEAADPADPVVVIEVDFNFRPQGE